MKRLLISKLWLLISIFVILLTAAIFLKLDGPDKGVSMTFQNVINHPNGRMALFVVTNQWDRTVSFDAGPLSYQVKIDKVWKDAEPDARRFGKLASDSWEWGGTLEPGAWATVAVVVPEAIHEWRAAVRSAPPPGRLDRLIFHLRANMNALRELKPLPGFKGSFHGAWAMTNYSREFAREIDMSKPSSFTEAPSPSG